MACPQCESKNLLPTHNMNESACSDCGCEFKSINSKVTIYEHGSYKRFVESVFSEIDSKIIDPSISTSLKANVKGFLNEGEKSLRNLINEMVTNAEDLLNMYNNGRKEKEDFTAVMEAITRFYTWAKLNEQENIIPEGYYDDEDDGEVDLDAIMGNNYDDDDMYNDPVDADNRRLTGGNISDDEIDNLTGVAENMMGSDIEIELPSEQPDAGLPPNTDIAIGRIQNAADEIKNAVSDLSIENGDNNEDDIEQTPVGHGVTMMAPQTMGGVLGGFISEGFAFKLGDKVFIDNVSEECIVTTINESKITVKNHHGDATTIDMADEYRERDIQFAYTEDADIIMERSAASSRTLKEKYLAMMDSIENENMGVNFNINENIDEGANSNWDSRPKIDSEVLKSYPSKINTKAGAVGGESEDKEGKIIEGTDDTGLGMDSNTGLGMDTDEGHENAAEKSHDLDGTVTSSVENAEDESDGIEFPDIGDGTGVDELHENFGAAALGAATGAMIGLQGLFRGVGALGDGIGGVASGVGDLASGMGDAGKSFLKYVGGIFKKDPELKNIKNRKAIAKAKVKLAKVEKDSADKIDALESTDDTAIQHESMRKKLREELAAMMSEREGDQTPDMPGELEDPISYEDEDEAYGPLKVIRTTYEKWTTSDIEIGDTDDKGWIDERGEIFNTVEEAVEWLQQKGNLEPSSSQFHTGIWYSNSDAENDYQGDTITNYAYHLDGFNEAEQEQIYNSIVSPNVNENWEGDHKSKIQKLKDDLDESVINDHFHDASGKPMRFPFTQDPTNVDSKSLKGDEMEEEKEKNKQSNKKIGIEETALKGLREGDVINRNEDFKTQWVVTKIDRNPLKVHLKNGSKIGSMNPIKESFQYIDGVGLGYERGLESIGNSKDIWAKMEESINNYDKKGLMPLKESVEENKYKKIVNEERSVISKEELYRFCKENELHKNRRNETLQELVNKFGNTLEEMERVLDDVSLSESDSSIDPSYGVTQMGELDTHFALKNAYAQMESSMEKDDYSISDKGGRPKTDNSEETNNKHMGASDDIKINMNEGRNWYNL